MSDSRFVGDRLLSIERYDLLIPAEKEAFVERAAAARVQDALPEETPSALVADERRNRQLRGRLGFIAVERDLRKITVCGYAVSSQRLHRPNKLSHVHLEGMRVANAYRGDYVGTALMHAMVGAHSVSEAQVVDPHDFIGRIQIGEHEGDSAAPAVPVQRGQHDQPGMVVADVRHIIGQAYPDFMQINLAFR